MGFVPNYIKELNFDIDKAALVCGPPIMIKLTLDALEELGYEKKQVFTTLELKMKCGIGKCGRCNVVEICVQTGGIRCDHRGPAGIF